MIGHVNESMTETSKSPYEKNCCVEVNEDCFENAKKVLVRDPKDFESVDFWLNKAYKLRDGCHMFDIPLSKAAIQFPYFNDIV